MEPQITQIAQIRRGLIFQSVKSVQSDFGELSRGVVSTPRWIKCRSGRTTWAVLAFLLLFAILIVCVSEFYLLPALSVVKDANPAERLRLEAYSRLLLAIVLFILVVGLMLTFRIGRFFFPRPRPPKVQTKYVDAWAEAGRRAETPPDDQER